MPAWLDEASKTDIRTAVPEAAERYLKKYAAESRQAGRGCVERLVDTLAPRYRSVLKHVDEDRLNADLEVTQPRQQRGVAAGSPAPRPAQGY
jgi:hypothetical protein